MGFDQTLVCGVIGPQDAHLSAQLFQTTGKREQEGGRSSEIASGRTPPPTQHILRNCNACTAGSVNAPSAQLRHLYVEIGAAADGIEAVLAVECVAGALADGDHAERGDRTRCETRVGANGLALTHEAQAQLRPPPQPYLHAAARQQEEVGWRLGGRAEGEAFKREEHG
eukprot:6194999-Pleurochrysis_carterae.AAC.1